MIDHQRHVEGGIGVRSGLHAQNNLAPIGCAAAQFVRASNRSLRVRSVRRGHPCFTVMKPPPINRTCPSRHDTVSVRRLYSATVDQIIGIRQAGSPVYFADGKRNAQTAAAIDVGQGHGPGRTRPRSRRRGGCVRPTACGRRAAPLHAGWPSSRAPVHPRRFRAPGSCAAPSP